MGVLIISILKHTLSDETHHFHIVDGGISDLNKDRLYSLKDIKPFTLEFIDVSDSMTYRKLTEFYKSNTSLKKKYISEIALAKFIIPEINTNLDKVLYLDCDMFVLGSLVELWNTDLADNYAAVVPDLKLTHSNKNLKLNFTEEDLYFNSGMILLNIKKWREDNLIDGVFDSFTYIHKTKQFNRFIDQDQLNYLLKDNLLILPLKYNLFTKLPVKNEYGVDIRKTCTKEQYKSQISSYFSCDDLYTAISQPIILHYVTMYKPWNSTDGVGFRNWREYVLNSPWADEFVTSILKKIAQIKDIENYDWYKFSKYNNKDKIKFILKKILHKIKTLKRISHRFRV